MNAPMFLVRGTVIKTPYMADKSTSEEVIRLVLAASPQHAERKFRDHFEMQSDSYGVSYTVRIIESSATIC